MIRVAAGSFDVMPRVGSQGLSLTHAKVSKVYTPLRVTLTLIEDEKLRLCLISADFLIDHYMLTNLFRGRVARVLRIPVENTFFFSSHNHTDAAVLRSPPRYGVPDYNACATVNMLTAEGKDLLAGLERTARRLPGRLVPARVAWGLDHERRISYNRKGRRADGSTYLMREEDRLLLGKDFNGDIDDDAFVVAFIGENGKPVCFLTQFSAHPATAYHSEFPVVHGDFPQVACADLSRAYGGVPVGFMQGCSGELESKGLLSLDPIEKKVADAVRFGHYLGGTYIRAAKHLHASQRDDIAFAREWVPLPFRKVPSERYLRRQIAEVDDFLRRCERGDTDAIFCVGLNAARTTSPKYRAALLRPIKEWAQWALRFHTGKRRKSAPKSVAIETVAIRLGDVGIVGLACEAFCGLGRQIKRQTALPVAIPCGYVDEDSVAYIPDAPNNGDMDYQSAFYRYTTSMLPFKNPAGDLLARAGVRMLERLAK